MKKINIKSWIVPMMFMSAHLCVQAQDRLYDNEFPLGDVELLDGPFKHACDLNVHVLLKYDTDRLLAPYLKEAGLTPKAESFPCWDGLDGHVGGHYLSALAIHYAATGVPELKERMDYVISELKRCQDANGDGYVGGVPDGARLWDELRKGNVDLIWKYWVPWYNVHKTYAGLRDAWVYTGNETARDMFLKFCDWGLTVIAPLDDKSMESMLGNEFGGMDEVYADAYAMTGDSRYIDAAKRFSHHWLLDSMVAGVDNLDNKHANTQVPKVVGYQRIAELSGDADYYDASRFFWHTVADTRSLSIGGNSRREHFASKEDCKSYVTDREGPETCNTNNMLKLIEGLFRMSPDAHLADFYERALYNHILSSQHPDHGGYVYFTSARPGHYRVYSQPNAAMWCCVGTGMENHGKYGQFIYTHESDSLYVNLFMPSRLNWKEKGVTVTQETAFPDSESTRITISTRKARRFPIMVRYPGWCKGMTVKVNGKAYTVDAKPESYVAIDRKWKNGDVVEVNLPMEMRLEEVPNLPEYVSIVRGPIVLGASYGTEGLNGLVADDSRWAHIAGGPLVSVFDTPILVGERSDILSRLSSAEAVPGKGMTYVVKGVTSDPSQQLTLQPFARLHDCRYMMYWLMMTPAEYNAYLERERAAEEAMLALDRRTVDAVNTGEQQPEADHFMESERSNSGVNYGVAWRDASDGGFFTYRMKPSGKSELALRVRYWGNEGGKRAFSIFIDDTLLTDENVGGKWNKEEFVDVEYPIPASMIDGKEFIKVKFQSNKGNTAGGVYNLRLVAPEKQ
nr:glycoside hydrolase family 127 protein [uncultured Duncaniella sp.]